MADCCPFESRKEFGFKISRGRIFTFVNLFVDESENYCKLRVDSVVIKCVVTDFMVYDNLNWLAHTVLVWIVFEKVDEKIGRKKA